MRLWGKKEKLYSLSSFSDEDQKKAKEYLKKAFEGWLLVVIDDKIDQLFETLFSKPFSEEDEFTITLHMTTAGNDILAAIGASIKGRKKQD